MSEVYKIMNKGVNGGLVLAGFHNARIQYQVEKNPNPKPKSYCIKEVIRSGNSLSWDVLDGKRMNGFKNDQMNYRKKGFLAFKQVWMQHLAQEVSKSLADESQQGNLKEVRLEKEQIESHHYITGLCQRLILDSQGLQFSYSCTNMYRKGTKLSAPLLVSGRFLQKVHLGWGVCIIDFSPVHSSCL